MIYDYHNTIDFAKQQGYEMGREEGRQEGFENGVSVGREEGRQEGLQEGRQEGRQEGLQEGRQEEKVGVAVRMHEMGMDLQVIAEVTGFNEEELKEILQGR